MHPKATIFFFTLLSLGALAAPAPAQEVKSDPPLNPRQFPFTSALGELTSAVGGATSVIGSLASEATSLFPEVTSIGGAEYTVLTDGAGDALTLAKSGAGIATSVGGSILTVATQVLGSIGTEVVSDASELYTVITAAVGSKAITLAPSGSGIPTTWGSSVYHIVSETSAPMPTAVKNSGSTLRLSSPSKHALGGAVSLILGISVGAWVVL